MSTTSSVQQKSPRVEIVSWNVVGQWTFNTQQSDCSICHNKLTEACASCMESKNIEKEECHASKGRCNHAYHYHCIKKWLNGGNQICPIDGTPWRYEGTSETMTEDAIKKNFKMKRRPVAAEPAAKVAPVAPVAPVASGAPVFKQSGDTFLKPLTGDDKIAKSATKSATKAAFK